MRRTVQVKTILNGIIQVIDPLIMLTDKICDRDVIHNTVDRIIQLFPYRKCLAAVAPLTFVHFRIQTGHGT